MPSLSGRDYAQGRGFKPRGIPILSDTFLATDGTNPSDRASDIGGPWIETDTGGRLSVQSNQARFTTGGVANDPKFLVGPHERLTGRVLSFDLTPGQTNQDGLQIGFWSGTNLHPVSGDRQHIMWFYLDGNIYCRESGGEGAAAAYVSSARRVRIVLKATGATYFYDGVQIADLAVNSGGSLYIGIGAQNGTWDIDNILLI